MLIHEAVEKAVSSKRLKTYLPIISQGVKDLFDEGKTNRQVLYNMLQHEFSVQIKGRTDCTIDKYYDIKSIENGIPCISKADKEFVFSIFMDYQKGLQNYGTFDVDDVTMEALSRLNAPIWRRERLSEGFDYIFADEMHLFNINEQSIFHFLTKTPAVKEVPICFALDYAQAIGDQGDISADYISGKAFGTAESKNLQTVFRSSPQIAELCASIAASGTLMFGANFANPYNNPQYGYNGYMEFLNVDFYLANEHGQITYQADTDKYQYTSDDGDIRKIWVEDGALYMEDGRMYYGSLTAIDWLFTEMQNMAGSEKSDAAAETMLLMYFSMIESGLITNEQTRAACVERFVTNMERLMENINEDDLGIISVLNELIEEVSANNAVAENPDLLMKVEALRDACDTLMR